MMVFVVKFFVISLLIALITSSPPRKVRQSSDPPEYGKPKET